MHPEKKYEFIVVKKSFTFGTCSNCGGTGKLSRTFRKMVFVKDCPECKQGRKRFSVSEEVPLVEALNDLHLLT